MTYILLPILFTLYFLNPTAQCNKSAWHIILVSWRERPSMGVKFVKMTFYKGLKHKQNSFWTSSKKSYICYFCERRNSSSSSFYILFVFYFIGRQVSITALKPGKLAKNLLFSKSLWQIEVHPTKWFVPPLSRLV